MEPNQNKNNIHPECSHLISLKTISILTAGLLIGMAGLLFVKDPPATILLEDNQQHIAETKMVLQTLTHIEELVVNLKIDILNIKNRVYSNTK